MRQRLLRLIGFCVVFTATGSIRSVSAQNQHRYSATRMDSFTKVLRSIVRRPSNGCKTLADLSALGL